MARAPRTAPVRTPLNAVADPAQFPYRLLRTVQQLAGAPSAFLVVDRRSSNAHVVCNDDWRRRDADLGALLDSVALGPVVASNQPHCYLGHQLPLGARKLFAAVGADISSGPGFRMLAILAEPDRTLGVLGLGRPDGHKPFSEGDLNRLDDLRSVILLGLVEHLRATAAERDDSQWRSTELPVKRAAGEAAPRISGREREIGGLLVDGYSAVNIAALTGLSEGTVRTYVRRLYRKLGVCSRAEMVRAMLTGAKHKRNSSRRAENN
jgi:DNA-binding CsgD family transcriptional regulator